MFPPYAQRRPNNRPSRPFISPVLILAICLSTQIQPRLCSVAPYKGEATARSGTSQQQDCAEWERIRSQWESDPTCYNGDASCCQLYDDMHTTIVKSGDSKCVISNEQFYLNFFTEYCVHTQQQQPATTGSPSVITTSTKCVHCSCNECSTCVNGCYVEPTAPQQCNTCGCPGYVNCHQTDPPVSTCTGCGCPGVPTCAPPCTSCGCIGYPPCQATHPPPTTCTGCGCSGTTTTPCNQAPVPCSNAQTPCNQQPPPPTPSPRPCTGTDCHCVNNACSCTGEACISPTAADTNGGDTSGNTTDTNSGGSTFSPLRTVECLHGSSTVTLASGARKQVRHLQIGDVVQTGFTSYSRVFMFTHRDASAIATFVQLTTSTNASIALTGGHFIHTAGGGLKQADDVRVGDQVFTTTHMKGWVSVTDVRVLSGENSGIYNPQTMDGDIVVDDILVSTYTSATRCGIVGHSLLSPLRAIYRICGGHITSAFK